MNLSKLSPNEFLDKLNNLFKLYTESNSSSFNDMFIESCDDSTESKIKYLTATEFLERVQNIVNIYMEKMKLSGRYNYDRDYSDDEVISDLHYIMDAMQNNKLSKDMISKSFLNLRKKYEETENENKKERKSAVMRFLRLTCGTKNASCEHGDYNIEMLHSIGGHVIKLLNDLLGYNPHKYNNTAEDLDFDGYIREINK